MIRASLGVIALAAAGPVLAKPPIVDVPQPPTAAGAAPETVLAAPIAPQSGPPQTVHPGEAVANEWWHAFKSPGMDRLVARALGANSDIAVAAANLKQAHELAAAARGVLFPQVDAGYTVERQRVSGTLASPLQSPTPIVFTLHTAQVNVAYSLDLFGGAAARTRSARAAERATLARLDGVRNIVSANVALAVIQNAALEAQVDAARASIASNRQILTLLRTREALGAVGKADVVAQEAALAAAEGSLPPLERASRANLAALAVLVGQAPGSDLPDLPKLEEIALPADLPLSLPSQLVAQRPDVRASAAAMEGAAADAKTALAARLPAITLSASAGGSSLDFGSLLSQGNPFWTLIGGLTTPLFHGGALRHQHHAAEAALEGAKAGYRGVALQAFADVSNALTALSTDAEALDAASRADSAARTSLGFIQRQLELGAAGTFAVLGASATAQAARSQLVVAKAARLSDTVGLFTALGGGQFSSAESGNPAPQSANQ
ncbi:MAG: efflux transporter outer membrane subunit [Sphingomonadales bacterium]|nr:efflux transporter outer membrane subunit [Sphingomonadales bacterium]